MSSNLKELNIKLSGRVQGVGFRYFAREIAKQVNVKGWVRNTFDGKVEIKCCGEEDLLNEYLDQVKNGPSHCQVSNIEVHWNTVGECRFNDFTITFL